MLTLGHSERSQNPTKHAVTLRARGHSHYDREPSHGALTRVRGRRRSGRGGRAGALVGRDWRERCTKGKRANECGPSAQSARMGYSEYYSGATQTGVLSSGRIGILSGTHSGYYTVVPAE